MEEWPLLVALMEKCPMNPMMCPCGPTVFTADLNLWGAPGHACGCKAGQACQAHLGRGFITVDSEDPRSPWHSGNSNPELGNAIKHSGDVHLWGPYFLFSRVPVGKNIASQSPAKSTFKIEFWETLSRPSEKEKTWAGYHLGT